MSVLNYYKKAFGILFLCSYFPCSIIFSWVENILDSIVGTKKVNSLHLHSNAKRLEK